MWSQSLFQDEKGTPSLTVWSLAGGGYFRLRYRDGTEFVVDCRGTRIWASWPEALTLEDTATYLLGPVMGFVLRLRGFVGLHASAVRMGDHAVALLGPPEAGKSTTAAAFARMGYGVLSDDLTLLVERDDRFLVPSGYPLLRLWEDSARCLFGSAETLPRLTPNWEKRYLDLTRDGYRFEPEPLPLAAIYLLGERSSDARAPFLESLGGSAGVMALVGNAYVSYLQDDPMRARELEVLGRVAATVGMRRVTPHGDPAHLLRLCDVIFQDFQGMQKSAVTGISTQSK